MTRNLLKWPSEVKTKQGLVACPKEIVTVVVTCHNQGHFLRESIGSILSQTRLPDEILIVDDGSSDNTRDEARRFPEVIYIRQDNSGLAAARNTGLSRSRGDLLVFLDADDRLLPHALEAGLDDFAAHPECAFVFGAFRRIDATGRALADRPPCGHWERMLIWAFSGTTRSACTPPRCFVGARYRPWADTTPRFPPAKITICISRSLDVLRPTSTHA